MTAYPSSYTDRTTRFLAPCAARRAGLGVHLGRPGRLLGAGPGPYLGPAFLATAAPGQRAPEPSRRTPCPTSPLTHLRCACPSTAAASHATPWTLPAPSASRWSATSPASPCSRPTTTPQPCSPPTSGSTPTSSAA